MYVGTTLKVLREYFWYHSYCSQIVDYARFHSCSVVALFDKVLTRLEADYDTDTKIVQKVTIRNNGVTCDKTCESKTWAKRWQANIAVFYG